MADEDMTEKEMRSIDAIEDLEEDLKLAINRAKRFLKKNIIINELELTLKILKFKD